MPARSAPLHVGARRCTRGRRGRGQLEGAAEGGGAQGPGLAPPGRPACRAGSEGVFVPHRGCGRERSSQTVSKSNAVPQLRPATPAWSVTCFRCRSRGEAGGAGTQSRSLALLSGHSRHCWSYGAFCDSPVSCTALLNATHFLYSQAGGGDATQGLRVQAALFQKVPSKAPN